ncbi:Alpha/Beta hydrolase protein [Diplogelasinospora grovesii]|uniref:Alpha/Beta hydrolase protein n=1 Tax=Diplogelasinospora grovesii TaxID=303347 RepID=A0AAN6N9K9_9PEZI|nr:Alpha/Beta hydrolase protein [Diplogelasinospora grovesii]
MFNLHLSYKWLQWRAPPNRPLPSLPSGIERFFIQTPGGRIEMLYAKPKSYPQTRHAPFYFVHGGMGGAWVWLEYLSYFSARGIPCYAVSMRGHGSSWHPSFLRMVYGTTKRMLADDVVAGIRWVQEREEGREEVVLVGHSSGGGLSQFILSEQDVKVKGLALVGAVPGFGSVRVYWNWFCVDPLFTVRMILHGHHPNSPLSHPALTRQAFFSNQVTGSFVEGFQRRICAYESLMWPLGMGRPFVDPQKLIQQISGWGTGTGTGQRLLVLAGEYDKLVSLDINETLASMYRGAYIGLVKQKKLEAVPTEVEPLQGEGDKDNVGHGVRVCLVPGAGHHMQNDVMWEVGAQKLLAFYEQL